MPFFKTFATKGVGEIVKEAAIKAISIAIPGTPVVASFAGSISKIPSDVRTPLGTLNSNSTVQGDQLTSYEAKSALHVNAGYNQSFRASVISARKPRAENKVQVGSQFIFSGLPREFTPKCCTPHNKAVKLLLSNESEAV